MDSENFKDQCNDVTKEFTIITTVWLPWLWACGPGGNQEEAQELKI